MLYTHHQAYKALHTNGIPTIALPYLDCIVWGQCGETLKDRLQTLQNKTALTIAKLRYDEANYGELLTEFGRVSVKNLVHLDTTIFCLQRVKQFSSWASW